MQSYDELLAKDKQQLQFLLQIVSGNRSAYSDAKKITLTQQKTNHQNLSLVLQQIKANVTLQVAHESKFKQL